MSECKAIAALSATTELVPHVITRRTCTAKDVVIKIKYAGICHSDIHQARSEWGPAIYPLVPGHEIAGHVVEVGAEVTNFQVGDTVGVGVMVDSCQSCGNCMSGEEQFCASGSTFTYNSRFKYAHCPEVGNVAYGGYSQSIVVTEGFVVKIPTNLDLAASAPLLCAGITTYSPLAHFGLRPFHKFAVVGLGGLGHMAVKFGIAFGAHTTVISRGTAKKENALQELGAHAYIDSTNADEMAAAANQFDFILNAVSAKHDITSFMNLLKVDGKMVMVGLPPEGLAISPFCFVSGRRSLSGSLIGGVRETQEMLDFCGRHNITCDIELIDCSKINEAYARTIVSDVKYRFVIDIDTM